MQFCPECENLLYPIKKKNGNSLICKFCGYERKVETKKDITEDYRITEKINRPKDVEVLEEEEPLPKVTIECPKCNFNTAFHWEKYNDDGEIVMYYRCAKCKHVWAEVE